MPAFGAAHLLNRTLIDLVLLPSLANLDKADNRRRSVVYAYSGARPPRPLPPFKTVALDLVGVITLARLGLLESVIAAYEAIVIPHATLLWLFQERQRATFHQPSRIKDAHYIKQLVANKVLTVLPSQPLGHDALVQQVGDELASLLVTAKTKAEAGNSSIVVRSAPVLRLGSLMEEEADLSGYAHLICGCQAVVDKLHSKGLLNQAAEQKPGAYVPRIRCV